MKLNNQKESKLSFKNIFQRETKLATYIIACCTILVLGISYAVFFQVNQNSNNQVVEAGDLTFTYQDGNQITSSNKSTCFEPMSQDEAGLYSGNCSYQFSVQNTGSLMGSYTLTLTANQANTAPADQVKVLLKRQNAEGVLETVEGYPKKVSEIPNKTLLENGKINVGESIVYSIQLYVDESTVVDSNVESGTAYYIDYMINGIATVHEEQDVSTEETTTAVNMIKALATTQPDQLAYDGTSDNNLRYIGANPNNYISFNNEVWRIVGVMNNIDDGTGKKESRVKMVREEAIGEYSWDNKGAFGENDWSKSALQLMLNEGAYWNRTSGECPSGTNGATKSCDFSNTGLTEEAKNMIGNTLWNLGGASKYTTSSDGLTSHWYAYEKGTEVSEGNVVEWVGKIGLMYPSDYGNATSGGPTTDRETCLNKELKNWDDSNYSDCINNNWLFSDVYQWTLTPRSTDADVVFGIDHGGNLDTYSACLTNITVFPVFYLKSDVKIAVGDGSESNPYTLSL